MLAVPHGFVIVEMPIAGRERHAAGRLAAEQAVARLGAGTLAYDGPRPIVIGANAAAAAVSITHTKTRALAVAAPVACIGIDLVDDADADRLDRLADRYLVAERDLLAAPHSRAACFAAKEAGLKALGLGLLDGGMFDASAVRVLSLDPPKLDVALTLLLGRTDAGTVAVAYSD